MEPAWLYSILSVFVVSLISLIGVVTLSIKINVLRKAVLYLVSLAAGSLIGGAFLHLIPELASEVGFGVEMAMYVLYGIIIFFIVEKLIHWRHCHIPTSKEHPHPFAYMNLVGDGVHNFIDGVIIAASYLVSLPLGIATTIAVIIHEIPQEIGDFGVLIHGGFGRGRALFMNFLTALTAIAGAVVTLFASTMIEGLMPPLLAIAAGGFVYIASSDLIPELHKECNVKKSFVQMFFLLVGMYIMYLLVFLE